MNMQTETIMLSAETAAVIQIVAASWRLTPDAAIEQIVYQQAAVMSGWPGDVGAKCRAALTDLRTAQRIGATNVETDPIPY